MKKVKVLILISTIFFMISDLAFSANELFRSITSGNWNSLTTWEMSTNNGSTWIPATLTPTDASGTITVRFPNTVTVTDNVSVNQLTIDSGTVSIDASKVFTLVNGTGNDLTVLKGGTVSGAGTFQTQGTVDINLRGGSNFLAALKVNTGTATISDQSSPFISTLRGNVTVDAGATLSSELTSSYTLFIYGTITNNGTITGSGSGNTLKFLGSSLTNNGAITSPEFSFDSTSTITGTGTYTGQRIFVTVNGDVSLLSNTTFSVSDKLSIENGGIISANTRILVLTSGEFEINSGGSVLNSGTVRTQGTVKINPRSGSSFNANLSIATGTTTVAETSSPFSGKLFGNVFVANGAILSSNTTSSYTLLIYGNITNDGTITGSGAGNRIKFYGSTLTNNGAITSPEFSFDSTTSLTGAGTFTGMRIFVTVNGDVSLLSNVTFSISDKVSVETGGIFSANSRTLLMTSGRIEVLSGGLILNSGLIRTQNNVSLDLRNGSGFNANLNVATGTTTVSELASPFNGRLFANVTVDAGAILSSNVTSSYTLYIYGNLTNNGTITGAGIGNTIKFYGASLINNGSITSPVFTFDSTSSVSGSGTYTGADIIVGNNGNVTLLNNVTFSPTSEFDINTGGALSANTNTLTLTSGVFTVFTGATVSNSGLFRTQNNISLNLRTGSNFLIDLNVASGTTIASELSSPFNGRIYGDITVDNGATLSSNNTASYTLFIFGDITNNGTISGVGDIDFQSGTHTIQGTGRWTADAFMLNGAVVDLLTNHQFHSVTINAGGTFNIGNKDVKFSSPIPIVQNGTFTNVGSKIEYNAISQQLVPGVNINYYTLRINNSAGTYLTTNISIPDSLTVMLGDLDLNGKIITIGSTGYMSETPGNTVKGSTGYIITTRNVGTPSALNVGGIGAVLTATTNLGVTEIRRGHTIQSGLNGGTSIRRYYDITPTNNTGLVATLVYKFDDSELNGKPEPSLKLFKSTNTGSTWQFMGGNVNIATNEITLPGINSFSRWSADSSAVSAAIGLIMEGFYNIPTNNLNMTDTIRAYLRNTTNPYAVVDSSKGLLDSLTFKSGLQFSNAPSGTYYLQVQHRNSLQTWSKFPIGYIADTTLNYNFTVGLSQAFGDNMKQKGTKFCIYSGDINQDGNVDGLDAAIADNQAFNFLTGYVSGDVNGNRIVDVVDISIVDNNAFNFVTVARP